MLTVKEDKYGKYVVGDNYKKGETVLDLSGQMLLFPNRESIQIGDYHVHDEIGQYINHSFSPTCAVVGNSIVALVDILNTEITFNYTKNESVITNPFIDLWTGKPVGDVNVNDIKVIDPIVYTPDGVDENNLPAY